ncbi:helix-turn-helix transcriptional regulator [Burkholderia sp. BCC1998]|uniref:response regulator transcription factor n=1 Tax=Burkholderia sp. BCC1998 TaxID=2817447 RepID=UPI002AB6E1C9|nr:helix-turn-helix transcriptional regulator [Burkholderia sp. BCC1998]
MADCNSSVAVFEYDQVALVKLLTGAATRTRLPRLSPLLKQTLLCVAVGMSNKEISRHLGISEHAIAGRIVAAQAKLDARNRVHAVALAIASGQFE